jgi:hypothetical protein
VYQGSEWNIPAAEHGTVFVHPGRNEVALLKEFENSYDGSVKGDPFHRPRPRSQSAVCHSRALTVAAARSCI